MALRAQLLHRTGTGEPRSDDDDPLHDDPLHDDPLHDVTAQATATAGAVPTRTRPIVTDSPAATRQSAPAPSQAAS